MSNPRGADRLAESVHRIVQKEDGRTVLYSWADKDDYIAFYRRTDQLDEDELFEDALELHSPTFRDWLKRNQTGCLFASKLARTVDGPSTRSEWAVLTISRDATPAQAADIIDEALENACDTAELLQVTFPGRDDMRTVVEIIEAICGRPAWHWVEIPGEDQGVVNIGLRWRHPSGRHEAWVVGFGPSEDLPFTRRAPLTALAIRTRLEKRSSYTERGDELIPIHLADLDDELGADVEARDEMTRRTKLLKGAFVGDYRAGSARARVTFCVPRAEAQSLLPG